MKRLTVSHAFHSVLMEPMLAEFGRVAAAIEYRTPQIPVISNLTGEPVEEYTGEYWVRHVREAVRFADGVKALAERGVTTCVEIGPDGVLTAMARQTLADAHLIPAQRADRPGATALLTALARIHTTGAAVGWRAVFDTWGGRTVPLPTYAFQRERYWLDAAAPVAAAADPAESRFWDAVEREDADAVAGTLRLTPERLGDVLPALSAWRAERRDRSAVDSWRYRIVWKPLTETPAPVAGTWLLATAAGDPGAAGVADALRGAGIDVVELAFTRDEVDRWSAAERLLQAGEGIAGVLSLLALDDEPHPEYPPMSAGLVSTVVLTQALGDAGIDAPLWCATRGAVAVSRSDAAPGTAQAQAWGLGRVAALEFPQRWGGLVDLPPELDERAAARLASVLTAGTGEDQVAVRASGVFARRLAHAPLSGPEPATWTPQGPVLITGGTGALGAHVARWLAGRGAPRLLLTSRSGPDARGAAALVAELAELGAEAVVVACDVADRDTLAVLLAEHPVSAVVHTAGITESVGLAETGVAEFADVLHAKVTGAANLDELLGDGPLEAFITFSSIAGVWGSGNQAAYAAANAYLDALAERRRARGLAATSVAWGPWADGGMAAAGDAAEHLARRGLITMPPALAVRALGQAVDHGETTVTVADMDWERFAPAFGSSRTSALLGDLPEVAAVLAPALAPETGVLTRWRERLAPLGRAERSAAALELVAAEVAAVLGYADADQVGPQTPFKDLGVDSLTAVEVRDRLAAATGLRLPASLVFDYPKPAALADHLGAELAGERDAPVAATVTAAAEDDDPIVIVGMGCRFPGGVRTPEELWRLLAAGEEAISEFPADRGWDLEALFEGGGDGGTSYVRAGGFLHDAGDFDPGFFGISPREAVAMDPQQRLLLEVSWEAFERAGVTPGAIRGSSTGVFVGSNGQDYSYLLLGSEEQVEGHLVSGATASIISGRLAYTFGLEGPAVTVDTACSSSLVALHLAAQALRNGECTLALAGGVSVMSTPGPFVEFSTLSGLARDGRCKAFADAADGTGWGEGAAMLVVERLSDARRNGHPVLAVIRGSAVNQDGASHGLTAPNGPSQQRVIRQALANAGLTAADVDAVEGHGTGTRLGDPIEAQALLATYGQDREEPLRLGSLKSNIGHTQAASGVAGVMKMVLAMRHGTLPATLHVDEPTRHVDWTAGAVELVTETTPWPETGRARRAGISSFGASGTNVHIVIEGEPAPAGRDTGDPNGVRPYVLSAKTAPALRAQAHELREHLAAEAAPGLADTGHSLVTTRSAFEHRAVVVAADRAELTGALTALAQGEPAPALITGKAGETTGNAAKVAFLFPGQGSQWAGMALDLLETSPVFRARFEECAHALAPHIDFDPFAVLRGDPGAAPMDRVDVVQSLLFAVMVSLAELWRSNGVVPSAVAGHSQGEIAAACVAGALSLQDAAAVVALRSQAIAGVLAGHGGMASVALPAEQVRERLARWEGRLDVAAVNGPGAAVVSGEPEALGELLAELEADEIRAKRIPVDYASHSAHVEAVRDRLAQVLAGVTPREPEIPIYSSVTGDVLDVPMDGEYWYTNLRRTVRFEDATRALLRDRHQILIEVSPHPVLTMAVQETIEAAGAPAHAIGTLRRDDADRRRVLTFLAEAHVRGAAVDWAAAFAGDTPARADLPTYAFQRKRYWPRVEPAEPPAAAVSPVEERFWDAVAASDVRAVADTIKADGELDAALGQVLPALSSWHRRVKDLAEVDAWRHQVRWTPVTEATVPVVSGRWAVIVSAGTDAEPYLSGLRGHLADLTVLTVDPLIAEEDHAALLREAAGEGPALTGILSLLALDENPHPEHTALPVGLTATLSLLHAVVETDLGAPLWCVTRGAVGAAAGEAPDRPQQAQIWGLGRVAALEHPRQWGGLVDLPRDLDQRAVARLAGALARTDDEDQLAVRKSGVYARRMAKAAGSPVVRNWRPPSGATLITGGTGAIGGHVARWLAANGAGHLVLISRRGPAAAGAAELEAELTALGARVTVRSCDVADRDEVAALLDGLAADGVTVRSVMHTAGLGVLATLEHTSVWDLAQLITAKIAGARHLDDLLDPATLDSVVYFSSISGVWGVGRHGGYAAGNAYLDAYAERRRQEGVPVTSIAWGPWGGGGMVDLTTVEPMLRRGVPLIQPQPAMIALQQALDHDDAFIAAAEVDWETFIPAFTSLRPSRLIADLPEARRLLAAAASAPASEQHEGDDGGAALRARLAGLAEPERERALLDLVRTHAAIVLGHEGPEAIESGRAFREFGVDSLTAVELRNRLAAATGLTLPATLVFDQPTPVVLAAYLRSQIIPDEVTDELPTMDELDRLDAALAARTKDDIARVRVVMRLESLLAGLRDPAATGGETSEGDGDLLSRLSTASNDELFDLVDRDLGLK
ncbi:type I polyketide synthase [Spongiactinospora sp. TRM90649]|uniref:type I polyketide synthase n=1 Tax=Spongiactinospora sp. TRM90649 TaxID=3031114 RepID=UPI0023FA0089|nr:type I polyketide synthase [Spongiactinospora sp. TRM90649]MDF5759357.1 SDR family NAD(P)-dependent oxidoreductase [Spongiactinospora sp. TRM90649]